MTQPRATTMSRAERPDQPLAASDIAVSCSSSGSSSGLNILWTDFTLTDVKPHLCPPPAKSAMPWCNIFSFLQLRAGAGNKSLPTCIGVPMVSPTSLQHAATGKSRCMSLPTSSGVPMVPPTLFNMQLQGRCRVKVPPHLQRCADGATTFSSTCSSVAVQGASPSPSGAM